MHILATLDLFAVVGLIVIPIALGVSVLLAVHIARSYRTTRSLSPASESRDASE